MQQGSGTTKFVRADGPDKVTGSGRYAADMVLPGMLFAAFRYAEVSHARIVELDVEAARSMPGVLAVLTDDDVPDVRYGAGVADRTLFARGVVRFEGEVVAAVAATTPEAARSAADAIVFEYEELPAIVDVEQAIEPVSPLVHAGWEDYEASTERGHNVASYSSITLGDTDTALAAAHTVVTSRYVADASHAVPIEPRAVLAQWEGDKVTIWSSTQVPFDAQAGVCETLEMPANRVRVVVPHLGGGFGGKCGFHFEAHVAALARAARRPVKLVFTRREEFTAPDRRREGMVIELTSGLDADGRIVARTGEVLIDCGAYIADGAFFPQVASMHIAGPYSIPNVSIEASLVYTNHQPSGSVRAPTAPQGCWAVESHTDELAETVGLDPVEFRRLNAVREGATGPSGQVYGPIGLLDCIDAAVASASYGTDLAADEAVGVAVGWWPTFAVPSGAYVKINGDGSGQIITGAQECGTGSVMTLCQLAAEEVGLNPEDFQLVYQDTAAGPWDMGATGSQTLVNNGRAVVAASQQIADALKKLAADQLEASPDDIELLEGQARVVGTPAASIAIGELAAIAAGGELLLGHGSGPPPVAPEISATCVGDQGMAAWVAPQFSCHAIRVKVDRDTGVVRVLNVAAAHDSGTIINPMGAQGQVHGGVLMGIGQALSEGTVYDDRGNQMNPGLLEYKLQTIADAPPISIDFVGVAAPDGGPRGSKGIAEAPNVATAAAIANGIAKVVGARLTQLPMKPERVWEASSGAAEAGGR